MAEQQVILEHEEELGTQRPETPSENKIAVAGAYNEDSARAILELREAQEELRTIKLSSDASLPTDTGFGYVGATIYYFKKGFGLLFMNGPDRRDPPHHVTESWKLSTPLSRATGLLESAAEQKNPDAIYLLAEMNFFGNFSQPRNYQKAFRRYAELASLTGNNSAQYMIGFMYATGIGKAVERDQSKALILSYICGERRECGDRK